MSMILKISAESGVLHVVATGEFSLAEAKRTFIEMLEAVARNKVGKVLFDGRRLVGNPTFMERFYYGKFAGQTVVESTVRGASPSTQFAYVLKVPMRDPEGLGEKVALSRGMRVKVFDDLDSALGWLQVAPVNHLDAEDDT